MATKSYIPHLFVNGEEVALTGFQLDAPEGKIGLSLGFDLLDPDATVERGDEIDFSIDVNGHTVDLIVSGVAIGRNKTVASSDSHPRPADQFKFSAADSLGEGRLSLAPRTPLILYDPAFVQLSENETDTHINDQDGERIYAEARSIANLDVLQAMETAYVEGAGFDEVITNIFNYELPRVDFPLTGSFHKSVEGFFRSQYKPQIFEDTNRLFIVDARGTLPAGFDETTRIVSIDDYVSMTRSKPDKQAVNALLLTTHETGVQEIPSVLPGGITERTETATETTGSTITGDYQQTVVTRHIAQLHEDEANPSRVTTEIVYKTVHATTAQDEEGIVRLLQTDTQTELFDYNFSRKRGYDRTIDAYVQRPGELANTENVLSEQNRITWEATGSFGEFRKLWEAMTVEGLVMIQGEDPDIIKTVLTDANRFGSVPEDATIERQAISTKIFHFRETGPDQVEITTQGTDHLSGRPIIARPQQHTGTIRIQLRGTSTGATKQFLLRDEVSEGIDGAREPITWDAGYLPFEQAFPLAERVLADAKEPPETLHVVLLKPDFGLRRGSLRRVEVNRSGNKKLGIVTGYKLNGTPALRGMCLLTMEFNLLVIN